METSKGEGMVTMDRALTDLMERSRITDEVARRYMRAPQPNRRGGYRGGGSNLR